MRGGPQKPSIARAPVEGDGATQNNLTAPKNYQKRRLSRAVTAACAKSRSSDHSGSTP